ncbi:MAG: DUF4231 domain-containing protein [Verrucomicrobiota bacterium]
MPLRLGEAAGDLLLGEAKYLFVVPACFGVEDADHPAGAPFHRHLGAGVSYFAFVRLGIRVAESASMTEEAFAEYLKHRFDDQCDYYSRQAAKNRSRYLSVQTVTIVACALSPLIAMMPESGGAAGSASIFPSPKILMALLAAVAGVCTALEKLMKFQDNWVSYREIREALRRERALFDTGVEDYAALPTEDERRRLFVVRVEGALRRESSQWVAAASNRPGNPAPVAGQ